MAYQALVSSLSGPLLILPLEDDQVPDGESNNKLGLFNLKDKITYDFNVVFETSEDIFVSEYEDDRIVGSSHGWLMVSDKCSRLTLTNVFSREHIELPHVQLESSSRRVSIQKAILTADPSRDCNYMVVIIYGYPDKLAFYRCRNKTWTTFSRSMGYHDLAWNNNMLYALRKGVTIEGWNIDNSCSPTRKISVQCRYIGEFVNPQGDLLCEADTLSEEDSQPRVYPYRTFHFQVYNVDMIEKKVNEVHCLKDQVIFLGGNHSFSVSAKDHQELNGNSIYFTDDYWDHMFIDTSYGGHDIGCFSLEDKSISPVYECEFEQRFYPTPFWIMPNN